MFQACIVARALSRHKAQADQDKSGTYNIFPREQKAY